VGGKQPPAAPIRRRSCFSPLTLTANSREIDVCAGELSGGLLPGRQPRRTPAAGAGRLPGERGGPPGGQGPLRGGHRGSGGPSFFDLLLQPTDTYIVVPCLQLKHDPQRSLQALRRRQPLRWQSEPHTLSPCHGTQKRGVESNGRTLTILHHKNTPLQVRAAAVRHPS